MGHWLAAGTQKWHLLCKYVYARMHALFIKVDYLHFMHTNLLCEHDEFNL